MKKHKIVKLFLSAMVASLSYSEVPKSLSNMKYENGELFYEYNDKKVKVKSSEPKYTLKSVGNFSPKENGILLDLGLEVKEGRVYFGFIKQGDGKNPLPVFYKSYLEIKDGKVEIPIKKLDGEYDMIAWEETGYGKLGYRIQKENGDLLYDGKINFVVENNLFYPITSVIEGPFINNVTEKSATLSFETNNLGDNIKKMEIEVKLNGEQIPIIQGKNHYEIEFKNLKTNTKYNYSIKIGDQIEEYYFETALPKGSKESFSFAYSSDSRHGTGGGSRRIEGVNADIISRSSSVAQLKEVKFYQFTGDMINGYLSSEQQTDLEYSNWKRSIEPYAHYIPFYIGMGNHEVVTSNFNIDNKSELSIDKFPYETKSAEAIFAKNFVLPKSNLKSEDNSKYDPNKQTNDFPSYEENVYSYTYGNMAMIVLNSNYWYSPALSKDTSTSGNLHGYIMDNQLEWLKNILNIYEKDADIDYIFVTQHTPAFPNGGHVGDDMWYDGDNSKRAFVSGKPVEKGIIDRRDEYLELLMKNSKVVGMLTGDEHNYNRLLIDKNTNIYPKNWEGEKINNKDWFRPLWQINNGASGAPYYSIERTPWTESLKFFTTQTAVTIFHINESTKGQIRIETINPETLSIIEDTTIELMKK